MPKKVRMSLSEVVEEVRKSSSKPKVRTCLPEGYDDLDDDEQVAVDLLIIGKKCLKEMEQGNVSYLTYNPEADWCNKLSAVLEDGSAVTLDYDEWIGHDDLENDAVGELEGLGIDADFDHVNEILKKISSEFFSHEKHS